MLEIGVIVNQLRGDATMARPPLKPGQIAPNSGQYVITGPRGGDAGGAERTVVRGERMPPTPQSNQRFVLVDPTKNGSGRR